MELTDKDIDRISEAISEKLNQDKHDFWIPSEEHYNDHKNLKDMHKTFSAIKMVFWYFFVGLVAAGLITLAIIGAVNSHDISNAKDALREISPRG